MAMAFKLPQVDIINPGAIRCEVLGVKPIVVDNERKVSWLWTSLKHWNCRIASVLLEGVASGDTIPIESPSQQVCSQQKFIHSFIHPRFVSRNHVARFQSISQIVVVVQSNHAATIYMCASKHRMRRSSGNEMTSDSPSLRAEIIMQFGQYIEK